MHHLIRNFSYAFKDFLFLSTCLHCTAPLRDGEQRVCQKCWDSLSVVSEHDHTFRVLSKRFSDGGVIDELVSLYYFEKRGLLQTLAHSLKYDEGTMVGIELGRRLSARLIRSGADAVIPVPLNKRKERERGYNQSDCIGDGIAERLGIPVFKQAVCRIKYTVTQTHLNAEERKQNIAEAFSVARPDLIRGKCVAIVDDVITTGSTIQELAKVLRDAGAVRIIAASVGLAKLERGE